MLRSGTQNFHTTCWRPRTTLTRRPFISHKVFYGSKTASKRSRPRILTCRPAVNMPSTGDMLLGAFIVDFSIQILGWAIASILRSEKFYDALGTLAYLALALGSLAYGGTYHARQITMTSLVVCWTVRLGTFLLMRVIRTGGDSRFSELKHRPLRFLVAWVLQALWVYIVSLPLLLLNSSTANPSLMWTDIVGVILWSVGFVVESVADYQKSAFKSNPDNRGKFVNVGLWAWARYPNYFGEMVLWWGIFLGCSAVFEKGEWAAVASPLFVAFLLIFVSGVPLQEAQGKLRWGSDPAYEHYRSNTNLLVPIPRFWQRSER